MEKIELPVELYLVEKGKLYPCEITPGNIFLGMCVNFRFTENLAHFTLYPEKQHIPFFVTMIERVLDSPFTGEALRLWMRSTVPSHIFDEHIDEIHNPISHLISIQEVADTLHEASKQLPIEKMSLTAAKRANISNTLLTVSRRLDLCKKLSGYEGAELIGTHQRNLVVYLLLTCFDRLGQPAPYLTFEQFLDSKKAKHKSIRRLALEDVGDIDYVQASKILNRAYTNEYGVRNSFYRFIENVLSDKMRSRLLRSIRQWKTKHSQEGPFFSDDEEKKRFLYSLRNSYTHQAESTPGLTIPLPESNNNNTRPEDRFYMYDQIQVKDGFDTIGFSEWPQVLYECVEEGLIAKIKELIG